MSHVDEKKNVSEEILAGDGDNSPSPASVVMDYAPESFWVSKDSELEWFDRNAFLDRKNSSRGPGNLSSNIGSSLSSFSGSQRCSVKIKPKALLIGLPKSQKQNFAETSGRRIYRPKKSGSVRGKPGLVFAEPVSPRVSCIGRVRSKKDRSRRGKNRKKPIEPGLVKVRSIEERKEKTNEPDLIKVRSINKDRKKKTGFWNNLRLIFRSKKNKTGSKGRTAFEPVVITNTTLNKKRGFNEPSETNPVEPPGLGGVKRFASGRRSNDWVENLEMNGVKSGPLDRGSILERRNKNRPENVNVDRNWQTVGPVSV